MRDLLLLRFKARRSRREESEKEVLNEILEVGVIVEVFKEIEEGHLEEEEIFRTGVVLGEITEVEEEEVEEAGRFLLAGKDDICTLLLFKLNVYHLIFIIYLEAKSE